MMCKKTVKKLQLNLKARTGQETAENCTARLQSKFQNLNAKVNQNVDRQTDGHHQSISRNCFAIRPESEQNCTSRGGDTFFKLDLKL